MKARTTTSIWGDLIDTTHTLKDQATFKVPVGLVMVLLGHLVVLLGMSMDREGSILKDSMAGSKEVHLTSSAAALALAVAVTGDQIPNCVQLIKSNERYKTSLSKRMAPGSATKCRNVRPKPLFKQQQEVKKSAAFMASRVPNKT